MSDNLKPRTTDPIDYWFESMEETVGKIPYQDKQPHLFPVRTPAIIRNNILAISKELQVSHYQVVNTMFILGIMHHYAAAPESMDKIWGMLGNKNKESSDDQKREAGNNGESAETNPEADRGILLRRQYDGR
jgi:hypothetical protein